MHPFALLRYLRLPLHAAPLALVVIFSVMLTLAEHAGIFGVPLFLIAGSWTLKYGFALLDSTGQGRSKPPVLSAEMVSPIEQRPLWLFLMLMLFYSITAALQRWIGDVAVTTLRVLLLAMVPSMVAAMSVTGSVVQALNPVVVFGTIVRIPAAYATLLLTIGAIWFVGLKALQIVGESFTGFSRMESFLPGQLLMAIGMRGVVTGLLGLMLFIYLWLAMFACIGGTIYERRRELAIDPAGSPERAAARANAELERQRDKTMDRIFAELRGGSLGNAGETVRRLIAQSPQPLEECRWLYARATAIPDQRLANYLAQLALPLLFNARATGEALSMARQRLSTTPEFRPETAEHLLRLAKLARDAGYRAMARSLLEDFSRCYPNDPLERAAVKLQSELAR